MMAKNAIITLLLALLISTGCTKKTNSGKEPQDILAEYVSLTFSIGAVSDKEKLLNLTANEVKESLSKINDLEFKRIFIDSKRTFNSLKLIDKRQISDDKISFTYELAYTDKSQEKEAKVTNKKICNIIKVDGSWKISEVQNIKTFIENTEGLSLEGIPTNLP